MGLQSPQVALALREMDLRRPQQVPARRKMGLQSPQVVLARPLPFQGIAAIVSYSACITRWVKIPSCSSTSSTSSTSSGNRRSSSRGESAGCYCRPTYCEMKYRMAIGTSASCAFSPLPVSMTSAIVLPVVFFAHW